jgi:hypothetical protein
MVQNETFVESVLTKGPGYSKTLQNLTKLGFLVRKETFWQPCLSPWTLSYVRLRFATPAM